MWSRRKAKHRLGAQAPSFRLRRTIDMVDLRTRQIHRLAPDAVDLKVAVCGTTVLPAASGLWEVDFCWSCRTSIHAQRVR